MQWQGFDIRLTAGAAAQGAAFDDDDPATDSPDAKIDLFARLNAEWTSPDGILLGFNVEQNSRRRASEVLEAGEIYGFAATDYGRIEVDLQDVPADTLAFAAPLVALGQVRGEFSRYAGNQALLRALDTQDAFKVIYLSPPIGGLRGGYVDFAAHGVAVAAIDDKSALRDATGTSFAAPIVAARRAARLRTPDSAASRRAVQALEGEARDLGPRGRDPIYGVGLIGEQS